MDHRGDCVPNTRKIRINHKCKVVRPAVPVGDAEDGVHTDFTSGNEFLQIPSRDSVEFRVCENLGDSNGFRRIARIHHATRMGRIEMKLDHDTHNELSKAGEPMNQFPKSPAPLQDWLLIRHCHSCVNRNQSRRRSRNRVARQKSRRASQMRSTARVTC